MAWSGVERAQVFGSRQVTDEVQKDLQIFCALPNVSKRKHEHSLQVLLQSSHCASLRARP